MKSALETATKKQGKHFSKLLIHFGLLGLLISCSQLGQKRQSHEYLELATLWVQNSSEYRALCYQAYNTATERLKNYKTPKGSNSSKPLAIVFDLDETVIDNSPYQAMMVLTDTPFSSETWDQWIDLKRAAAVPGAKAFLTAANSQGFELFFVSNRMVRHLDATYQNLIELGLPVKKSNLFLRTHSMGKDSRRAHILKDYNVVLYLGDVMTDFSDDFENKSTNERHILTDALSREFGKKYIVFPNPMYGEWERALYGHDLEMSAEEKSRRRKRALYRY